MAYRIIWSRTSLGDLRSLVRYIAKDNPPQAEVFGYRILSRVEMLAEHPRLGRQVPEFGEPDLREIIIPPYRVVYQVRDDVMSLNILRLWHAARNTPEID